jgi:hypothetical protein
MRGAAELNVSILCRIFSNDKADCERTSRIGSAPARLDSAHHFFPPLATLSRNIVWGRLAPVFLLVPAEFLRRSPCRRVQMPIPLTPTREALIVLLDRFRSSDKSGLQLTPNRANHECLPLLSLTAEKSAADYASRYRPILIRSFTASRNFCLHCDVLNGNRSVDELSVPRTGEFQSIAAFQSTVSRLFINNESKKPHPPSNSS